MNVEGDSAIGIVFQLALSINILRNPKNLKSAPMISFDKSYSMIRSSGKHI